MAARKPGSVGSVNRVGEVHSELWVIAERAGPLDPRRCDPQVVCDVLEPGR